MNSIAQSGQINILLMDKSGKVKENRTVSNLITNRGLAQLAKISEGVIESKITHMAIGSGDVTATPKSPTMNSLRQEIASVEIISQPVPGYLAGGGGPGGSMTQLMNPNCLGVFTDSTFKFSLDDSNNPYKAPTSNSSIETVMSGLMSNTSTLADSNILDLTNMAVSSDYFGLLEANSGVDFEQHCWFSNTMGTDSYLYSHETHTITEVGLFSLPTTEYQASSYSNRDLICIVDLATPIVKEPGDTLLIFWSIRGAPLAEYFTPFHRKHNSSRVMLQQIVNPEKLLNQFSTNTGAAISTYYSFVYKVMGALETNSIVAQKVIGVCGIPKEYEFTSLSSYLSELVEGSAPLPTLKFKVLSDSLSNVSYTSGQYINTSNSSNSSSAYSGQFEKFGTATEETIRGVKFKYDFNYTGGSPSSTLMGSPWFFSQANSEIGSESVCAGSLLTLLETEFPNMRIIALLNPGQMLDVNQAKLQNSVIDLLNSKYSLGLPPSTGSSGGPGGGAPAYIGAIFQMFFSGSGPVDLNNFNSILIDILRQTEICVKQNRKNILEVTVEQAGDEAFMSSQTAMYFVVQPPAFTEGDRSSAAQFINSSVMMPMNKVKGTGKLKLNINRVYGRSTKNSITFSESAGR